MITNIRSLMNNNNILENIQSIERNSFKSGKNPELQYLYDNNYN